MELSIRKTYSLYGCGGNTDVIDYSIPELDAIDIANENEVEDAYWDSFDGGYNYNEYYNYSWRDREDPCTDSYYYGGKRIGSNILASDIGVIVKNGVGNSYFFAVTNLLTTDVIPNAHVELYNYQKQLIANSDSNEEGIVTIKAKSKAAFAIISSGANKTYVKLSDGNSLSLSKFNISGKGVYM